MSVLLSNVNVLTLAVLVIISVLFVFRFSQQLVCTIMLLLVVINLTRNVFQLRCCYNNLLLLLKLVDRDF